ncbi:hypothetical protein C7S18_19180 [Ahniella affigens]|uniref:Uncharacterized protein n=1 Tax=Ahniella affigens TaxID=2021234 RepID=A0A2P1PWE6_9GAMM|nr:hypothetical protein [Ahniella affigens]AVP99160.1 hypothetical protein C7S18_19180 [Ahniella affigens]
MTSPYEPPSAELGVQPKRRDAADLILRIASVAMSLITAGGITLVVPQFKPVIQGFGDDLPLLTQLVADYTFLVWLLPILTLAVALAWPKPRQRFHLSIVCGFVLSGITWALMIYAMYLPIFNMAAEV